MTKKRGRTRKKQTNKTKVKQKKEKSDVLQNAPADHYFVLENSRTIKNLLELVYALDNIEQGLYQAHANSEKNDFANWIKDIFKEDRLAKEIVKAKNRVETQVKILKHIVDKLVKERR